MLTNYIGQCYLNDFCPIRYQLHYVDLKFSFRLLMNVSKSRVFQHTINSKTIIVLLDSVCERKLMNWFYMPDLWYYNLIKEQGMKWFIAQVFPHLDATRHNELRNSRVTVSVM
jgi:hypothetical protein